MDRDWLVRIGLRVAMRKKCSLFLALALTACSTQTSAPSEYSEIVRTGYFEGDVSSGDWRAEYMSGEDARKDLSALDSLLAHHYAYNDADELDEIAVLGAISDALPDRIRVGDFAMQLQRHWLCRSMGTHPESQA